MLAVQTSVLLYFSHLDCKSADEAFAKDGYFCPQCFSKYCDLPVDCVTCGMYVGGVAQLLERRSVTSKLPWPAP